MTVVHVREVYCEREMTFHGQRHGKPGVSREAFTGSVGERSELTQDDNRSFV